MKRKPERGTLETVTIATCVACPAEERVPNERTLRRRGWDYLASRQTGGRFAWHCPTCLKPAPKAATEQTLLDVPPVPLGATDEP